MNEKISKFAQLLIEHVRDKAIRSCDRTLSSLDEKTQSVIGKRWLKTRSRDEKEFLGSIIADCVDDAIFQLLHAIDSGVIPLSFDGVDLGETGGSEMAGLFMCSEGWRDEFSDERYIDDFQEL